MGREAACAVVQSLGRFMAAYFTNRPLCILPPHNISVLPPLHLPHGEFRTLCAVSVHCKLIDRLHGVCSIQSEHTA